MNTQEAFKLLELNNSASKEEINTAFRKMAKKYHPDINKDNPDAEVKFKEINSAYQLLTNPKANSGHHHSPNDNADWQNINDIFNQHFGGFKKNNSNIHVVNLPPTSVAVNLTFVESVLGCDKVLNIDRNYHCADCSGSGAFKQADDCKLCKGSGHKQAGFSRGNVVFMTNCDVCKGTGKLLEICKPCSGKGYITKNEQTTLNIPGGVLDNVMLRTREIILHIRVAADPDMKLEEADVVSNIELSLLDAIKGIKLNVRTIKGDMKLKIPAGVKNKDVVVVQGYGVPSANGSHIFNVSVNYPENNAKLIEALEDLSKNG